MLPPVRCFTCNRVLARRPDNLSCCKNIIDNTVLEEWESNFATNESCLYQPKRFERTFPETPPILLNLVRRSLVSDLENYAPHSIDIEVNDSLYNNDIIRHRISMVPVSGNATETIEYQGPCMVEFLGIPIVPLLAGQNFKAKIRNVTGTGKSNAKFNHVSRAALIDHSLCFETLHDPESEFERAVAKCISRINEIRLTGNTLNTRCAGYDAILHYYVESCSVKRKHPDDVYSYMFAPPHINPLSSLTDAKCAIVRDLENILTNKNETMQEL